MLSSYIEAMEWSNRSSSHRETTKNRDDSSQSPRWFRAASEKRTDPARIERGLESCMVRVWLSHPAPWGNTHGTNEKRWVEEWVKERIITRCWQWMQPCLHSLSAKQRQCNREWEGWHHHLHELVNHPFAAAKKQDSATSNTIHNLSSNNIYDLMSNNIHDLSSNNIHDLSLNTIHNLSYDTIHDLLSSNITIFCPTPLNIFYELQLHNRRINRFARCYLARLRCDDVCLRKVE